MYANRVLLLGAPLRIAYCVLRVLCLGNGATKRDFATIPVCHLIGLLSSTHVNAYYTWQMSLQLLLSNCHDMTRRASLPRE
jgi:hypothetical protein